MQPDNKQLGGVSEWYKCPSCGLREEVLSEEQEEAQRVKEAKLRHRQSKIDQRGYYDSEGHNI